MNWIRLFSLIQWLCFGYFVVLNAVYLSLSILSFIALSRRLRRQSIYHLPRTQTTHEPPISLVVTAYNEEAVIVSSVQALLQLDYPEFEIVVVNDGSKDRTLEVLTQAFALEVFPEAFRARLPHRPVRAVYRSQRFPRLRVIDKENGGSKADAANAGIDGARYGHFCPLDADTILERDSLRRMVQPFMSDPRTIAVGGTVRIANGCQVTQGVLTRIGMPRSWVARFQVVEYLRAFLCGRVGWATLDALPLISGAFGLFHKESVIAVNGYDAKSLGEDMDMVLRLHRHFRLHGRPYRVTFVADPACWTEAPESLAVLKRQRVRWQRGLFDCLWANRELFFNRKSGAVGWLALPFLLFFESVGPIFEVAGYFVMLFSFLWGWLAWQPFLIVLCLSLGTGLFLSFAALLLEEMSFHTYPRLKDLGILALAVIVENFGFRQLTALWRLEGTVRWLMGSESHWGEMTRVASWQNTTEVKPVPPSE